MIMSLVNVVKDLFNHCCHPETQPNFFIGQKEGNDIEV